MTADSGLAIEALRVDGGMAASDWTMQFLADILPAAVERPAIARNDRVGRGLCRRARPRALSRRPRR